MLGICVTFSPLQPRNTMAAYRPDLLSLAQQVLQLTEQIVHYYDQVQAPKPNFDATSPAVLDSAVYEALRVPLNEAANDLIRIVNGPKSFLRSFLCTHFDLAAYQAALEYEFFTAVPSTGTITLSELARTVRMNEDCAGRLLRFLATQRVFMEVEPGVFQHTAASIVFVNDAEIRAAAHMQMDEMFRAASQTTTCFEVAPNGPSMTNTPFKASHGVPVFQYYEQHPLKAARFAQAMAGISRLDRQIDELLYGYPWASLKNGKVVDVGGGSGHVSVYLAQQFPELSFVVQDVSTNMWRQGQTHDLKNLYDRVTFMQHDFFNPQPVHDASAFFIRQCIHNWSDGDAVKILRAFVPALEKCPPQTPLLINDTVLPEPNSVTRFEEHTLRQMDLNMLVVMGAKQRTEKEFRELIKEADKRFEVRSSVPLCPK